MNQTIKTQDNHQDIFNKPYAEYKKDYIDFWIKKIDDEAYCRCGCYYEIYAEFRHDGIDNFIAHNGHALSEDDLIYIKTQHDYDPDFKPYTEIDAETGEELTMWDIVQLELA